MLDISTTLENRLMQETKADLIELMTTALDTMQAYNGRTITYCIVDALGGSEVLDDDGVVIRYQYPAHKKPQHIISK